MKIRAATMLDLERMKEIHKRAGYTFPLPQLYGTHVAHEDGELIAAAGYQFAAQIFAVLEPEEKSAHRRVEALKALHAPLAELLLSGRFETAFAFCDPQFTNFERRLMKMGWSKKLWPCMFLEREEVRKVFAEKEFQCT